MLFVSWQLKTTVYVILLASCLGQELFRVCEQDYCYERSINRQRLDREQSRRRLSNERNQSEERHSRALEDHNLQLSKETVRESRIKQETITEPFDYKANEGHKVWDQYQIFKQINERFGQQHLSRPDSEKSLVKRDYKTCLKTNALERLNESLHNRISDRDFKINREEHRFDSGQKFVYIQDFDTRLNNRDNGEQSYEDFDSEKDFENNREARHTNSKLQGRSYLARPSKIARELSSVVKQRYEDNKQNPVNRQNTLQRFSDHESAKSYAIQRDDRHRTESLHLDYRNEGEENKRRSISRQRTLPHSQRNSNININRQSSLSRIENNTMNKRRYKPIDEIFVRKVRELEQQERDISRNSHYLNQVEDNEELHNDYEVDQRSENKNEGLERFYESTHARISDRDFENNREALRANSKPVKGSYIARRLKNARELSSVFQQRYEDNNQKPVNHQNTLQRFSDHESSKSYDIQRDDRHRNENLQRGYRNEREENLRRSISRRQTLLHTQRNSNRNINRKSSLSRIENNTMERRLSKPIDELFVRKVRELEQQERDINRNSYYLNQVEIRKERYDDYEVNQRSERRGKVAKIETVVFRHLDDHNSRPDISHRLNNLLSIQVSENQEAVSKKRSENTRQNRQVEQFLVIRRSESNRQYSEEVFSRIDDQEPAPSTNRYLVNARNNKSELENGDKRERQETSRSAGSQPRSEVRRTRNSGNIHHHTSKRLHKPKVQRQSSDIISTAREENSEIRTDLLARRREILIDNSRRLEHERKQHSKRERVENCLEQRVDHERESDVNEHFASHHQDIVPQTETRSLYEQDMRKISQDTQHLRLDNYERNRQEAEWLESSRQYNKRSIRYNEKRESVRGNQRFEERNLERRVNSQSDNRLTHKELNLTATNFYRNYRFIEVDGIKESTVTLLHGYAAVVQGVLFAYVVMKTCSGKTDLRHQLQPKLREALRITGF